MSRRGRNNNWSRAFVVTGRPAGLRGKQIGLYYKNNRTEKKSPQRVHVNLTIPPAIIKGLEDNLKQLTALSKELNIEIPKFKGLNLIKKKIKEETDCEMQISNNESVEMSSMSGPSTSCEMLETSKDQVVESDDIEPEQKNIKMVTTEDTDNERILSLRGAGDYKYGYKDIITGTFEEKLDQCLSRKVVITKKSFQMDNLSAAMYEDYLNMLEKSAYKRYMRFRQKLPTYKKSKELLKTIRKNQVVVISGETGCGKSTQVPQLLLDDAIQNGRGAYTNILVTQPRRIAASSLAMRVAQERSEVVGDSVGYAVRLENVDARPRGSIMFCTTGILLSTLEVDQGLTNYSHIILDEVHERDCDIDMTIFILKKVLRKRKDLKLVLMSATLDAETLMVYFNKCPMVYIEGLAYPVKDVYLEEILEMTRYQLPVQQYQSQKPLKPWQKHLPRFKRQMAKEMEKEVHYRVDISPWLESIKRKISREVYKTLQDPRIEELNIGLICELILHISKGPPGAILVFLPGIVHISKLIKKMEECKCFPMSKYAIYPLHSKLPSLEQHKIFERPPEDVRKIIVSTNIAETSITIDDIVYVINTGRMKYTGLKVEENVSTLQTEWISKANLIQRRGRAGRCQPGVCYHLMSSYRVAQLDDRLLPEIQRSSLLETVLCLKRLRLGNAAEAFKSMPAPPADTTVRSAVKHLQQCGALDSDEKLTPLGWHLARLPVHPAAGKLLLLGALFGCIDRAASVAAVWGFKDPFQLVIGKEDEVDEVKRTFAFGAGSDQVAISEAIMQWEYQLSEEDRRTFAYKNFLAHNTLQLLSDMKKQFANNLKQMGFLPSGCIWSQWDNRNNDNLSLFKAIVAASLYPNIATARWANLNTRHPYKTPKFRLKTPEGTIINVHPSSVLARKRPKRGTRYEPTCSNPGAAWLVYWCKQESSELFLLEVTLVHTLPLLFFGEFSASEADHPDECCISITSVEVGCKRRTAELLFQMRSLLDQVLAAKISVDSTHATIQNPFEEQVLKAVIELITAEDERAQYLNEEDASSESDSSEYGPNKSWRR